MPSEKAGSWMAFFKKFSIDFNRAALWGIHCIPIKIFSETFRREKHIFVFCVPAICVPAICVPARGVLAELLCARWSDSGLEAEEVDGPGLLSIETSDTVGIHRVSKLATTNKNT